MKNFLKNVPEQVKRLSVILVVLIIAFFTITHTLIPKDFGWIGHYRTSALQNNADKKLHYAGQEVCVDCHDDLWNQKTQGFHKNLSCEVCHGPALNHAEAPDEFAPPKPRDRRFCIICHEYNASRPTGFPQIVSASHNAGKICVTCHNPHNPITPETPKECEACHGAIAKTKSLSAHKDIPCIRCHTAEVKHKTNPREYLPTIPNKREFCGECHAEGASSPPEIPRINFSTHEPRYVCWQCHYPHLPEAK